MTENQNLDELTAARAKMLRLNLQGRGITDPRVLKVMGQMSREQFVSPGYESQAYHDGPLPIGCSQTISQPYIVALMTQELHPGPDCEVLEIGTGSGYQTAVLAKLAKKVYTIEKHNQLSESAQAVLGRMGLDNVEFYIGDGSCGWPEPKTFDRIIFTATAPNIPEPLTDQLAEGGIMVGPVGPGMVQELVVCEKKQDQISQQIICGCRFVKLVGKYGFEETSH